MCAPVPPRHLAVRLRRGDHGAQASAPFGVLGDSSGPASGRPARGTRSPAPRPGPCGGHAAAHRRGGFAPAIHRRLAAARRRALGRGAGAWALVMASIATPARVPSSRPRSAWEERRSGRRRAVPCVAPPSTAPNTPPRSNCATRRFLLPPSRQGYRPRRASAMGAARARYSSARGLRGRQARPIRRPAPPAGARYPPAATPPVTPRRGSSVTPSPPATIAQACAARSPQIPRAATPGKPLAAVHVPQAMPSSSSISRSPARPPLHLARVPAHGPRRRHREGILGDRMVSASRNRVQRLAAGRSSRPLSSASQPFRQILRSHRRSREMPRAKPRISRGSRKGRRSGSSPAAAGGQQGRALPPPFHHPGQRG